MLILDRPFTLAKTALNKRNTQASTTYIESKCWLRITVHHPKTITSWSLMVQVIYRSFSWWYILTRISAMSKWISWLKYFFTRNPSLIFQPQPPINQLRGPPNICKVLTNKKIYICGSTWRKGSFEKGLCQHFSFRENRDKYKNLKKCTFLENS